MKKISITLPGIRRTCDKIESVLSRKFIDLKSHFSEIDPKNRGLISDTKFFIVVYNQLGHEFGVCQEEVKELADYFKQQDGRVSYQEFLELVTPSIQDVKPFVTGLEWEDHDHVNVMTPFELLQIKLILTKIADSCRFRDVFLEPFFKDYEKISSNNGTITVAHFRRILNFAGITLGPKEFQLLVKRFLKHGYTVNYVAFLTNIQTISKWIDANGSPNDPNSVENFPFGIITADVQKLPRPEIGKVDMAGMFGTDKACHPCVNQPRKCDIKFEFLMLRIKKHIAENSIKTREFFEKFDHNNSGLITKSQFHRSLDAIGLSGLHRLYVAPHDLEKIFVAYADAWEVDQYNWKKFCDDIDGVFSVKCLDKQPYQLLQSPTEDVELERPGTADWDSVAKSTKQLAQETVFRIRNFIKSRRISIEPFFKSFDKLNHVHVSRCQMRRVFSSISILLSEFEIQGLMTRYGDDVGFNYWKFMQEIDDVQFCESKHQEVLKLLKKMNEKQPKPCSQPAFSIVDILAKIKGQITRNRINIDQFLANGEILNEGKVLESKFRSSFSNAGIILDDCELDVLIKNCKIPWFPGFVDHKAFCGLMNEAFYQTKLEKKPRTLPIQHIPSPDDSLNFLNLEERCTVSHALQKLSRHHDAVSNMKYLFNDRGGCKGIISKDNLEQVLTSAGGLMELITPNELNMIFKSFSKPCGNSPKFDYKNFLLVLASINAM